MELDPKLQVENTSTQTSITFLGHSTVLIELDGMRLITDPVFGHRVFHLHRMYPAIDFATIRHVDAVLISHLHFDHLDIPTLRLFPKDTTLYVPYGAGRLMKRYGFSNCQELHTGDTFQVGPVHCRAVHADHSARRHPLGLEAEAIGYLFDGDTSFYFPGDTRLFSDMASFSYKLDVALMPVWGWGPNLGKLHMDPHQAAEALTLLKPRLAIPIHWGTYMPTGMAWMKPAFITVPPLDFARYAHELAPQVEIKILRPGETVSVPSW